jgi:pyridoxine 5-phosphate synthase
VPERRQELTTEGGLDVVKRSSILRPIIRTFRQRRIGVSLFIDPVLAQVRAAHQVGAEMIELHTGRYAHARTPRAKGRELQALQRAVVHGHALGLTIAAGHGLAYDNVPDIVKLQGIEELNIGFSIVSRAVWVGLERAVQEMVALMTQAPAHAQTVQAA